VAGVIRDTLLEHPLVYLAWQAPFIEDKLRPVFQHNDMRQVRRVLDVGCGPGTNAAHFRDVEYLGLDLNAKYIQRARKKYDGDFHVADVTICTFDRKFDFVLMNSLLHHLDDPGVERLLSAIAAQALSADGRVHIIDLVLPEQRTFAYRMARWDRGRYPRRLAEWKNIFERFFTLEIFEPYSLKALGLGFCDLIYFRGGRRS
jgi:SAM-dependent methyltransferase